MSAAQILVAMVGLVSAVATFCLMRFPHTRRPQFRYYGAFSLWASFLGAAIILILCALMVYAQGVWQIG